MQVLRESEEAGGSGGRDQETAEKESSLKEGKQTQDLRAQGASSRTPALDRGHLTSDATPVPLSTNAHWHSETGDEFSRTFHWVRRGHTWAHEIPMDEATCLPVLGQLSAPAAVGNQEPLAGLGRSPRC